MTNMSDTTENESIPFLQKGKSKEYDSFRMETEEESLDIIPVSSDDKICSRWYGAICAILCSVANTIVNILIKYKKNLDMIIHFLILSAIYFMICIIIIIWKRKSLSVSKEIYCPLLTIFLLDGPSFMLKFLSVRLIPLGDAITIAYCTPAFVSMISVFIFDASCTLYSTLLIVVLFTGICLVCSPPFLFSSINTIQDYNYVGFGVAITGTLVRSCSMVAMQKINKDHYFESFLSTATSFSFFTLSAFFVQSVFFEIPTFPSCKMEWVVVFGFALFETIALFLHCLALAYETATKVAVYKSSELVFGYATQILIFGQVPAWIKVTGVFLVVACVLGTLF